jgi:hypothetical protein
VPSIEERERQLQRAISRWENEGGAIAANERWRPNHSDDQAVMQSKQRSNVDQ